jgi:hypothetical protein
MMPHEELTAMMAHEEFDGARMVLVALLRENDDPEMIVAELDTSDRLFLTTKCCATIIEHLLCKIAHHHNKHALEGLEALYQCMRINIETRCKSVQ